VAKYISTLAEALDGTNFAGDRSSYRDHLAEAARLVALLAHERDAEVQGWIASEERHFGVGYLSGDQGEAATNGFVELAAALRNGS